jgi:hypothetical protein
VPLHDHLQREAGPNQGYRDHLKAVVADSAGPYGYSLTIWACGAVTAHDRGIPGAPEALLFLTGAISGFWLVGAAAHGGPAQTFSPPPEPGRPALGWRTPPSSRARDHGRIPCRRLDWKLDGVAPRRIPRHYGLSARTSGSVRQRQHSPLSRHQSERGWGDRFLSAPTFSPHRIPRTSKRSRARDLAFGRVMLKAAVLARSRMELDSFASPAKAPPTRCAAAASRAIKQTILRTVVHRLFISTAGQTFPGSALESRTRPPTKTRGRRLADPD